MGVNAESEFTGTDKRGEGIEEEITAEEAEKEERGLAADKGEEGGEESSVEDGESQGDTNRHDG